MVVCAYKIYSTRRVKWISCADDGEKQGLDEDKDDDDAQRWRATRERKKSSSGKRKICRVQLKKQLKWNQIREQQKKKRKEKCEKSPRRRSSASSTTASNDDR